MSKNIVLKASAAALAASLALAAAVPALAQPPGKYNDPELAGAPPLFQGQSPEVYRGNDGWKGNNDWKRWKPDFQQMQRDCSRAGIEEAWDRDYYSAQYNEGPRLVEGRYGWEMRGSMRLHGRKGYKYVDTVCEAGRGGVNFNFR